MVTEGYFVAAAFNGSVMQSSPPHFCTQSAWVAFLSYIENNGTYIGSYNLIFNPQLFAHFGNCGVVGLLTAEA